MVDKLRARFGKQFLSVPVATSNDAIRSELGIQSSLAIILYFLIFIVRFFYIKNLSIRLKLCLFILAWRLVSIEFDHFQAYK